MHLTMQLYIYITFSKTVIVQLPVPDSLGGWAPD